MKVLNGGPWMIFDHYLTILKWKPNFKPADSSEKTTIVWVRFISIPLEMFDDDSLFGIGKAVGNTIKVDSNTVDMVRGRYARVCVELNLNKPLMPTVVVWGKKYSVEYEGLQRFCFKCGCHGQKMEQCDSTEGATPLEGSDAAVPPKPQMGGTAAQPFGPWMFYAHVRWKQ